MQCFQKALAYFPLAVSCTHEMLMKETPVCHEGRVRNFPAAYLQRLLDERVRRADRDELPEEMKKKKKIS
jgi:hypothetical protein